MGITREDGEGEQRGLLRGGVDDDDPDVGGVRGGRDSDSILL